MSRRPGVTTDGEKIADLIAERGYDSYAHFARSLRRPRRTRAAISLVARGGPASRGFLRQIARALDVELTDIIRIEPAAQDSDDEEQEPAA